MSSASDIGLPVKWGERRARDTAVSHTMSRIRSKDTAAEVKLRKALWAAGLRYRKHYKEAPGSPDIAFVGPRVAVFCDGIFWHGRNWEARKAKLVSNRDYWIRKIERNMERDRRIDNDLQAAGWLVIRLWENEVARDIDACVSRVQNAVLARRVSQ